MVGFQQVQRPPKPPLGDSVRRALAAAKGNAGSVVRILTLDDNTQRAVAMFKREHPVTHEKRLVYSDPLLDAEVEACVYHLKCHAHVVASVSYSPHEYRGSISAYVKWSFSNNGDSAERYAYEKELESFKDLAEPEMMKEKKR